MQDHQAEAKINRTDYRNAAYQGETVEGKRHGFGLLLTDAAQLILADWQLNHVQGRYCYVERDVVAYGTVVDSQLTGFNCIRTGQATIYGHFQQNNLHGKAVLVRGGCYRTISYSRGVVTFQTPEKPFNEAALRLTLQKEFAEVPLTLGECLVEMIGSCQDTAVNFSRLQRSKTEHYYGFVSAKNEAKGVGMVIKNEQLVSCGTYEQDELHGLGRTYHNQYYEDGTYRKGHLTGVWINHNHASNESTIVANGVKKQSSGDAKQVMREIHREIHLRSTSFQNQIVVVERLMQLPLHAALQEQLKPLNHNISSGTDGSLKTENSRLSKLTEVPTRSPPKLSLVVDDNYDEEVSGSSPIKQINALQPAHFEQFQLNYQPQPKKPAFSPRSSHTQPSELFGKRSNILIHEEDKEIKTPEGLFRTIATLEHSSPPTEKSSPKREPVFKVVAEAASTKSAQLPTRNANFNKAAPVRLANRPANRADLLQKDTVTMVRQMEQEEKRKRIDLDRIYRETGIVRTKKHVR